ncbi:MAG: winged helix-turn-helix transcriptional regulator [Bacteroidia bacterium]|nr:winged helix-turn-helix transcriptional regulator [Bacteroidia bacterium]
MGVTRTDLFTSEQNELARVARVFGHPARIAIIQHLLQANACINSDLVHELGLAQATISQHLRELKDLGIIKGTIEGSSISYCIDADCWKRVEATFQHLFSQFKNPNDQCC